MRKVMYLICLLAAGSVLYGAEGTLMHCFYFTPIAEATDADWQAFHKATDGLTKQIPGMTRVWYGKLRRPVMKREHGVCMEFKDENALATYAKHEAHDAWMKVYEKVRQPGTSTFDILGK
jgi:hypothetical protein